jgi:Holliday junction resolvase RusA-like endonuclease
MQIPAIRAALTRQVAGRPPEFLPGTVYAFDVEGDPVPEGSLVSFQDPRSGKIITKPQLPGLAPWRKLVASAAAMFMAGRAPIAKPKAVLIGCVFRIDREGKTKAGSSRPGRAHEWPVVNLDQDKLVRAVRDALKGVVYEDDGQVVGACIEGPTGKVTVGLPDFKRWTRPGERPGVTVRIALVASAQRALENHLE